MIFITTQNKTQLIPIERLIFQLILNALCICQSNYPIKFIRMVQTMTNPIFQLN